MAAANTNSLACCVPMVDVCSMQPITRTSLLTMIKVNCTSAHCTESGFIHPDCFYKLEESLIRYVSTYQWSNSHKQESMRKFNWSVDYEREYLWKLPWIFSIIIKKLNCNCGNGYVKKDLGWPPTNWRKGVKKTKVKPKDCSSLPQLNHTGGKVRYVPAVAPEFPSSPQMSSGGPAKSIPGAVFADKDVLKRGVIVMWRQGVGQIRNLVNKEERLCVAREEVVEGERRDMEQMVGSEVEYKTEKRRKKLEAIMVRLVKTAEWRKGMVTHWVPEELAGVIKSEEEDVLVYRSEFVPGGFAPDIVGKVVKFKLDRARQEATCVKVEQQEDYLLTSTENSAQQFSDIDLMRCPQLAQALCEDSSLARDMGSMAMGEQVKLMDQLEEFFPALAAHPVGYKVVVRMVQQFRGILLDRVVRILAREFLLLSQSLCGAKCLQDSLPHLPRELQQNLVHAYSDLISYNQAVEHMTGLTSYPVFKVFLPLLDSALLRQLVLVLGPGLASLVGHPSLTQLVDQANHVDQQVVYLIASQLDAEHLLLLNDQHDLTVQLIHTGNVRVCGLVLHNMSGRLDTLLVTQHGQGLLTAFINSATDLQVELVMEELCQEQDDKPPIIMQLAVGCSDEDGLMGAVVTRARREVLTRMLEIFKHFKERIISSESGKRWISCISRKVNTDNSKERVPHQ